jgi:hypothetical protein
MATVTRSWARSTDTEACARTAITIPITLS